MKKTSGGTETTVTLSTTVAPAISGQTVTLTLVTALAATDTAIKVSYTKPTSGTANKLVDAASNETASFTDQPVTNNTSALPVITIAAGTSHVTEGTAAAFTLTRTGSATAELTVNVTVSESGDMVTLTNEGAKTATFTANSTTAALSVATVGDSVDEANSVVTMTVTATPATYTVGTPASATVTVQDDDSTVVAVAPDAPTGLSATASGTTAIDLSWTTPADNGGRAISGYKIEWSAAGSAPWTVLMATTGSAATTYSNTGLTAETTRHYRVSAINSVGTGAVSNTASATTSTRVSTPPTSSNSTVTTNEDTERTFNAGNFPFFDSDTGDTLMNVKITELPAASRGTLTLNGTAIASTVLPKTVTKAELDADKLKYSPPANANGTNYASFKFKVNDGSEDSASAYTMRINVTPVNDEPTGRPTVTGNNQVGNTLTASTSSIIDVDGLPSGFTYQWKRFAADETTFEANIGTNSRTYTLTDSEEGKKVKV